MSQVINFIYFLTFSLFILANIKYSDAFAECSGSNLADPTISGVVDCPSWAAYRQANQLDIAGWCSNSSVAIKCCWTCGTYQNFSVCSNVASEQSCVSAAASGTCNTVLGDGRTVSFYCARSCNVCSGTTGPQCASLGNVCGSNGVCSAVTYFGVRVSRCNCTSGFFGASCSRSNPCASGVNPCQNGASCAASDDADVVYTCTCPAGCTGRNCNQCGCAAGGAFSCSNSGVCLSNGLCQCSTGYSGSTCQTFLGCNAGGALSCLNSGVCLTNGNCQCTSGWSSNTCSVGLGCNAGGSAACRNGGSCNAQSGLCQCTLGFTGAACETGIGCNAGGSAACTNGGVCIARDGTCQCAVGYSGTTCQVGTACSSNPCKNNGVCTVSGQNAICTCQSGYYGYFCDSTSACAAPSPCQNGGTCTNSASAPFYTCACPTNYFGTTCQVRLSNQTCIAADTNSGLCSQWRTLGFCSYTYLYQQIPVPVYCPQACRLCSTIDVCQDTDKNCPEWSSRNLCGLLQQFNLVRLCRRSCNACPPLSRRRRSANQISLDNFKQ